MSTKIVILAAGMGKRMGADVPKALIKVGGIPMLERVLASAIGSGVDPRPIVIYGHLGEKVCDSVGDRALCVLQERQLGTGDAVRVAQSACEGAERVIVLYGDHPLVSASTIQKLAAYHESKPSPILLAVGTVSSFDGWQNIFSNFGRIVRDKQELIAAIREYKDATEAEREIREINPGYYVFDAMWLWDNIDKLKNENVQGEFYLTDLIQMAVDEGLPVRTYQIPIEECVGVNKPEELEIAEKLVKPA
ncbi:MAG: fused N-acetyl glucosamine-1-phosphate uridyltransferase [uncultured bacterium]|nr:MAG: fused N-acetyl glucosamine-1-phosphate uridyltransferase [uncultured bacterium]HBD05434.1 hypothetical protein [Candidatus Uhrbacteria bacterium]